MKKAIWMIAGFMCVSSISATAQIVETSPTPLQQSSKNVTVTYHADKGTAGLKGLTSGVYTHIGVITDKSNGSWAYAPSKWGDNADKYALEFVSTDTWRLSIGDIRTYFGITDPDEKVLQLAMVFRNADCTKEGKGDGGTDIFVDVYDDVFSMSLTPSVTGTVLTKPGSVSFTVNATENASLKLFVNDKEIKSATDATSMKADYNFAASGEYVVKATASNGKETVEKTINYLVAPTAKAADYPGGTPRMGAVKNSDGTVTFCLAAPRKESVIIVGSWDDYATLGKNVMNYQDFEGNRYFWTTVSGLESGKYYMYYYIVDGSLKVADPYAHLVLDNYSDKWLENDLKDLPSYPYDRFEDTMLAVYNDRLDEYDWNVTDFEIPAHDQLVIYELLLRDFSGNGGNGTLAGAHSHLNYLRNLGVNAIELMPIMEFNGNNSWGYNTNFYMAPDKAYGTPAEYKRFIDTCHEMGFAVILDIVFNQSDGLHPWYQMYDIKENPFYNAIAPHDYNVLNDWRQENALVQQQWEDAIRYWMTEYNVDGFRFDLVKGLGDSDSYGAGTEAYNATRVANMTRLHSVITSVKPDGIHINEHLAGAKEENEMAADGQLNWSNMNYAACQTAMGYSSGAGMNGMYSPNNGGRQWGSTVAYAESHDEERMGYKQLKWGATADIKEDDATRMRRLGSVAAQMLMVPGPKMIWQFAELGAEQTTKNADGGNNTDPKNVLWGFLDNEYRAGLYESYRQMAWMRRYNPDLFTSDANVTLSLDGWSDGRHVVLANGDSEAVLLVNPETKESKVVSAQVSKISASNMQVLSSSYKFEPNVTVSGTTVSCEIPAGAYVVVGTAGMTEIDDVDSGRATAAVYGAEGRIVITGDYDSAVVYDMAGRVYGSLSVPAGLYIVNVDGVATKVAVK